MKEVGVGSVSTIGNLSEDIPGYIDAPATALTYPWKTYIGGHLGRLGKREDIELHQAYIADIAESAQGALSTVDPIPYSAKYGQNVWAAVKGYLDAVTDPATAPVTKKYSGVLAGADIGEFTWSTTFMILPVTQTPSRRSTSTATSPSRPTSLRAACKPEEMDLAELLTMPGIREECILRSNVGFMALHGGSQDRGTEQIARRAAQQAGASYYAIVHPSGLRVHLTSRLHDPGHSARLRAFLEHVDVAISVHGFGRDGFALWFDHDRGLVVEPYGPAVLGKQTGPLRGIIVGGLHAPLLDAARELLHERFAGYHVAPERVRLGFHPDNPVNLPSAHGVQIELPPGLRGIGDFGETLVPRPEGIVGEVVAALTELAMRAADLLRTPSVSGSAAAVTSEGG